MNQLRLIIHSTTGYFKEKNGENYLIIDSTDKYEEVFSENKSQIETLKIAKELYNEKSYARIGVNTDGGLPLNTALKFSTLTIIIRCILQKGERLYPQIYSSKCLCELRKCCNTIELIFQKKLT